MIVKNESAVIERALASARPFISTWVIVDTGSTDGTQDIVRRVYGDISGELFERPWVNFGANRTGALELCRGRMDWAIMLDADDSLEGVPPPASVYALPDLDALLVRLVHGGLEHERIQFFRVESDWYYEGLVHEKPICR
jgi:glycosyltransferase involved in cell wall biosynthesis